MFPNLANFVTAPAYHFRLNLPAALTQPGDHLLAEPCRRRRLDDDRARERRGAGGPKAIIWKEGGKYSSTPRRWVEGEEAGTYDVRIGGERINTWTIYSH